MRISLLNPQTFDLKALFISLACHLAFIKLFFLVFNPPAAEFNPTFIFVGPILTESDFSNLTAREPSSAEQIVPAIRIKNDPSSFDASQALSKPAISHAEFRKQKTFSKSSFIKTPEPPAKNTIEDLGVDLSVPKRVPLRLNLK